MKQIDFRVSVIITSYNQKDYMIEALESVMNQTAKPHEIIIADDHSIDGSIDVIQEYIAQYSGWMKGVFQKRNVGIPKNRNAALRRVTGNYVAILDGDDRFLPYKIEKEMDALLKHPQASCVYSNISIIDAQGRPMKIRDQEIQPSGDIFFHVALREFGLLRSMLIDFSALQDVGLLDERFPKYDGYDLTVRLAKRCQFAYVSEPLLEYREYPNSDSRSLKAKDHLKDLQGIYKKMLPLLTDLSVENRKEVSTIWSRILFKLRVRDAVEFGGKTKALFVTLLAMAKGRANRRDLRWAIRLIRLQK